MDAVIIAGGVPKPGSPLWDETHGKHKALIDICGRPMIEWVIDATCKARSIRKIYVVGLPESFTPVSSKPLIMLPDNGGILENLYIASVHILEDDPHAEYMFGISCDIPAITSAMIDEIVGSANESGMDVFFNVISGSVMKAAFPGVRRTYIKLREGAFTAANMHVINLRYKLKKDSAITKFVMFRKIPVKMIAVLGMDILLRILFRKPDLKDTAGIILRRTGIKVKPMVCRFAEAGMDIDKPEHLALIRERLAAETL